MIATARCRRSAAYSDTLPAVGLLPLTGVAHAPSYRTSAVIYDPRVLETIAREPLVLIDVGARGGLIEPWRSLFAAAGPAGAMRVVGFEPDPDSAAQMKRTAGTGFTCIPAALWDRDGQVTIHLGRDLSTSSVHPPDTALLEDFRPQHGDPRRTTDVVTVPALTLDAALQDEAIEADVIKLDTQGAEWEILAGGGEVLESVYLVVAETWTVPVHKGQRLAFDVMSLMDDNDFYLADLEVGGRRQRRVARERMDGKGGQITQVDMLFLRDPARVADGTASVTKLVKAAAVADLFGFSDHSLELLRRGRDSGLDDPAVELVERLVLERRTSPRRYQRLRELGAEYLGRRTGRDLRSFPRLR